MATSLRFGAIVNIIGRLVAIDALILLMPMAVSLCYGESDWLSFLIAACAAAITGSVAIFATRHRRESIRAREGFIITASIWVVFGLFGIIPFMTCENPIGFTDAMFEIISGYTTTGASVIRDVEAMSHGILFWRALSQWIGGLGIIMFMLALLPELNKAVGISMFNAEATGITHDKIHPRIRQTALSIWAVYLTLTILSTVMLWLGPMDFFDSVCHTFTAIATGGFSTRNDGVMYWHSDYVLTVLTGVMFIGGLNFLLLFNVWKGDLKGLARNAVIRTFIWIIVAAYLMMLLAAIIRQESVSIDNLLVYPLFHVISAITSTGFSITGAEQWGPFALFLTILLMLCGSCAGSTAGGIKVVRVVLLFKNSFTEMKRIIHPNAVINVKYDGKSVHPTVMTGVMAFFILFMIVFSIGSIIMAIFTDDIATACSAVISCMSNIGPGFGSIGPMDNFSHLSDAAKLFCAALMLIGRLEVFTVLVLFSKAFWKR